MYDLIYETVKTEALLRNLTDSTAETYCTYLSHFLRYVNKDPASITCNDVRSFILFRRQEGLSPASLKLYRSTLHFFFKAVLHKPWDGDLVPSIKLDYHLPEILTKEEVNTLLLAANNLKHKAMLATMYSAGLRVSELVSLHYGDISRSNHSIHVRHGKNRCDRYAILGERNLELLTQYWYSCGRPMDILFPSRATGGYMSKSAVNQFLKQYVKNAGINKHISAHSLRHYGERFKMGSGRQSSLSFGQ